MKRVQNFGNLAVRELPYHLKYWSFGSLMPGENFKIWCPIKTSFLKIGTDIRPINNGVNYDEKSFVPAIYVIRS
jgi:hypothetical protein